MIGTERRNKLADRSEEKLRLEERQNMELARANRFLFVVLGWVGFLFCLFVFGGDAAQANTDVSTKVPSRCRLVSLALSTL